MREAARPKGRASLIIGDDEAVGVGDLVKRMIGGMRKERSQSLTTVPSADTPLRPVGKPMPVDRSRATKICKDLGDSVVTVAISEDESMFCGAGTTQVASVFSTRTGDELASFAVGEGRGSGINAVRFAKTRSGAKLVVGDFSGCLSVFGITQKQLLAQHQHGSTIVSLALPREDAESDRFTVAVMGLDLTAVYSVEEADRSIEVRLLCKVQPMGSVVATKPAALAMDGEGRMVATGAEKVVELWFVDERAPGRIVRPEVQFSCTSAVHSVALNRRGDTLAVGTANETEVYSVSRTQAHADYLADLDGLQKRHAHNARWRDLRTASQVAQICARLPSTIAHVVEHSRRKQRNSDGPNTSGRNASGLSSSKSSSGRSILSGGLSSKPTLSPQSSSSFSAKQSHAASASSRRHRSFKLGLLRRQPTYGRLVASGEWGEPLFTCEPLALYPDLVAQQGEVALSAHSHLLAVGAARQVSVLDLDSGATICKQARHGRIRCVSLSASGAYLAAGSFDATLELRDLTAGAHLQHLRTQDTVRSVSLSADAKRLALGSELPGKQGRVRLYDAVSDTLVCTWRHAEAVWAVALSPPDGTLLAAAGFDSRLTLYDTMSFTPLQAMQYDSIGGPAFVWSMAWSDDGSSLVVGCWNGSCYVYTLRRAAAQWRRAYELVVCHNRLLAGVEEKGRIMQQRPGAPFSSSPPIAEMPSRPPRPLARSTHCAINVPRETDCCTVHYAPLLTLRAVLERADRVYAVCASYDASRIVLASRDRRVALFDCPPARALADSVDDSFSQSFSRKGHPHEPLLPGGALDEPPLWEVRTDDFVYSVALSPDERICGYGGRSMNAIVVDAVTGRPLFTVPTNGTIWSVRLLDLQLSPTSPPMLKLLFGGEFTQLTVIDVSSRQEELQMPVAEGTYAVALTPQSLAFTNGQRASVYGKAGHHYAWHDPPSFQYVSRLLLKQQHRLTTDALVDLIRLQIKQHPAIVNAHDTSSGVSLVQLAVEGSCHPRILDCLLRVDCRVGLLPNLRGLTALDTALQLGDSSALRNLLNALLSGRFQPTPAGMRLVTDAFEALASKHPAEFLAFVSAMPLQAEPEIFLSETHNVRLPNSRPYLVCGNESRCPMGVWEQELEKHRMAFRDEQRMLRRGSGSEELDDRWVYREASSGRVTTMGAHAAPEALGPCAPCPKSETAGASAAQIRRSLVEHAQGTAVTTKGGAMAVVRSASIEPGRARSNSIACGNERNERDRLSGGGQSGGGVGHAAAAAAATRMVVESAANGISSAFGMASTAAMQAMQLSPRQPTRHPSLPSPASPATPLQTQSDRVQSAHVADGRRASDGAARKPRAGFVRVQSGGLQALRIPFEHFAGLAPTPDDEAFSALSAQPDGPSPLELIVRAADRTQDFSVFDSLPLKILLTYKWIGFARSEFNHELLVFVLHLTCSCIFITYASNNYDVWLSVLAENFWSRGHFVIVFGWALTSFASLLFLTTIVSRLRARSAYAFLSDTQRIFEILYNSGQVVVNILFAVNVCALNEPDAYREHGYANLTQNAAYDLVRAARPDERSINVTLTCQSFVMALLFFRAVFFFRGFLAFGALVFMVSEVLRQMVPFLCLLCILTLGFTLANWLLLHHLYPHKTEWEGPLSSLFYFLNYGFRFAPPDPDEMWSSHGRNNWQVWILYLIFMIAVQLVLLNLLVAIMSGTLSRLRGSEKLMARHVRARLVLELEHDVISRIRTPLGAALGGPPLLRRSSSSPGKLRLDLSASKRVQSLVHLAATARSRLAAGLASLWSSLLCGIGERRDHTLHDVRPRWLHVLMPADTAESTGALQVHGEGVHAAHHGGTHHHGAMHKPGTAHDPTAARLHDVETRLEELAASMERLQGEGVSKTVHAIERALDEKLANLQRPPPAQPPLSRHAGWSSSGRCLVSAYSASFGSLSGRYDDGRPDVAAPLIARVLPAAEERARAESGASDSLPGWVASIGRFLPGGKRDASVVSSPLGSDDSQRDATPERRLPLNMAAGLGLPNQPPSSEPYRGARQVDQGSPHRVRFQRDHESTSLQA